MYYVYIHTVPNGKVYVGQSNNYLGRWNNGEGYIRNRLFYKDIQMYGWDNIKHEIIDQFEDRESAEKLEAVLIVILQAENNNYGYNQTTIYKNAMDKYVTRVPSDNKIIYNIASDESFFEQFNLPASACRELIDQWIFNAKYRDILKSKLLDNITYAEMSSMYNLSVRQLKNIVSNCCSKILNHIEHL